MSMGAALFCGLILIFCQLANVKLRSKAKARGKNYRTLKFKNVSTLSSWTVKKDRGK